jgi:lipopolysaccharide biosynthesis glycosyltransferase
MRILITTVFDIRYKDAGKALFDSIRRHTDCRGIDFKVITADPEVVATLGKKNCYFVTPRIQKRYSNVQYGPVLPIDRYLTSWFRYEIFNMTEYDRIICLDADCICVEDISYLFSKRLNRYDIISVEDHIVSKHFTKSIPELEAQGLNLANLVKRVEEGKIDIQPALIVANKSIINRDFYKNLLAYANTAPFTYANDEGILNDFIYRENLKIGMLPLEWDYQDIYELICPELPVPEKPIIVHCQETKPFKRERSELDERMHKWFDLWWREFRSEAT